MVAIVMHSSWVPTSYALTDSDAHENRLLLFVRIRSGFKNKNRVIATNKESVEAIDRCYSYSPTRTLYLNDGYYSEHSHHTYDRYGSALPLVRVYDAFWIDSGESVEKEVIVPLLEEHEKREKIKKKLEEGAKIIGAYKKDIMQLVGGE